MATQQLACCINEQSRLNQAKRKKKMKQGKGDLTKWLVRSGIIFNLCGQCDALWGAGEDKMADEKGEIFFVICRCSFGVKCQTVNVKGGEER